MSLLLFEGCYSGVEDQICKEENNGTSSDQIFWLRRCMSIANICQSKELEPVNGTHCFNSTIAEHVPVSSVIHRVLASEEYY